MALPKASKTISVVLGHYFQCSSIGLHFHPLVFQRIHLSLNVVFTECYPEQFIHNNYYRNEDVSM